MLSRLVRIQLTLFGVITIAALLVMALFYVRIPAQLGVGRYEVVMNLEDAGGLYPKAHVTYRGTEVGQVKKLDVGPEGGVLVTMQIDDGSEIPADSMAQVRSASVIGEQYVDFVPPENSSVTQVLGGGDTISVDRTDLPTTTDTVLTSADDLLRSIPEKDLETTLDELDTAFNGTGDELGSLIRSSSDLVAEANENVGPTIGLIEDLGPVLQTQKDMDGNVRSFVNSLDSVTSELEKNDKGLRSIFTGSDAFLTEIGDFAEAMDPIFAQTLADVASIGKVLDVYNPAVEHALAVIPALQTMFVGALPVSRRDNPLPSINLSLRAGFDPPVCTTGFASANKFRDPDDKTLLAPPSDSYCKVAKDSPLVVRGARNAPCPTNDRRGPYAFSCGYVFNRVEVDRQKAQIRVGDTPNDPDGAEGDGAPGTFFLDALSGAVGGGQDTLEDLLSVGR
ncbi:hypothetical protein ASD11_00825 [Aeromicrobium sp. Root495]|uniref:MCE family protein n=1 Tax=Aeromicrobium sp. Root495 TaxID=1736550 RepID=UPI0006FDC82A|nr:MlaD family protein [Aeromicrobium sp. Root495]KQY58247.1 hypothetical protein ASD11_00825 [Aeromicrobium sp. Root495]